MYYWCFNCQKIILPLQGLTCQFCQSGAIQQMSSSISPSQFIPYTLEPQPAPQPQPEPEDDIISLLTMLRPSSVMMRTFLPTPTFTFFRIIHMGNDEEKTESVSEEVINKLPKVQTLNNECAVCQEKQGSGLRLGCNHEFHEHCIKPWFTSKNTCPCCRTTVQA